jgi:hypothetical protein
MVFVANVIALEDHSAFELSRRVAWLQLAVLLDADVEDAAHVTLLTRLFESHTDSIPFFHRGFVPTMQRAEALPLLTQSLLSRGVRSDLGSGYGSRDESHWERRRFREVSIGRRNRRNTGIPPSARLGHDTASQDAAHHAPLIGADVGRTSCASTRRPPIDSNFPVLHCRNGIVRACSVGILGTHLVGHLKLTWVGIDRIHFRGRKRLGISGHHAWER